MEDRRLETDLVLPEHVWAAVPVWEADLDHSGQGESLQAAVCELCHREAADDRQPHQRQLQPPGAAVSVTRAGPSLGQATVTALHDAGRHL